MGLNWMDLSNESFNAMLLLEPIQLSWLPGWLDEDKLATALRANLAVDWYMRKACPELNSWLDKVMAENPQDIIPVREAEVALLNQMMDLMVYALDPGKYDAQPFLDWDSNELISLTDWSGKLVLDIGAGTGRQSLTVASLAKTVWAVEPVGNLRRYLLTKAKSLGHNNVYAVDGLITAIPFPDNFADVVMNGHVFGDYPHEEFQEMLRVVRPGGLIILCPGNGDRDNAAHQFLVEKGFSWSRFEQPGDGVKRKYWLLVTN